MGTSYELRSVRRARAANVHFISEDRAGEGVFLRLTVAENLVATQLGESDPVWFHHVGQDCKQPFAPWR